MADIEIDYEHESPSGHVWNITASGDEFSAEPDVGIINDYIDNVQLFWSSGKEFSKSAYKRISQRCWENIQEELEAA